MSVIVYSRLGDLLRARRLTVDDLQGQIAARFDLVVDARTLNRLARDERVRRPDMEIAAAAAAVLDARLDDIFAVAALPMVEDSLTELDEVSEEDVLPPEQSRRSRSFSTCATGDPSPTMSRPSWTRSWARGGARSASAHTPRWRASGVSRLSRCARSPWPRLSGCLPGGRMSNLVIIGHSLTSGAVSARLR